MQHCKGCRKQCYCAGHFQRSVDLASHIADISANEYEKILQREEEPELLVTIPRQAQIKAPLEPMLDATVRLDYAVSTSGRGIHFDGQYCIADNQVSKAKSTSTFLSFEACRLFYSHEIWKKKIPAQWYQVIADRIPAFNKRPTPKSWSSRCFSQKFADIPICCICLHEHDASWQWHAELAEEMQCPLLCR